MSLTVQRGIAIQIALIATAAAQLFGCVEARTSRCQNLLCPAEKVCDENRVTCVLPGQVEACTGMATGAMCSFPGTASGACDHGVCHAPVCGNRISEPGELCDDGNIASGDGCRADCKSDESCGNGEIDTAAKEECDDHALASHDGCSSKCTVELPVWRELSVGISPGPASHQMVYDAARKRTVMFGGVTPTGDTTGAFLVYDGTQWLNVDGGARPPRREGHVMVYDASRRRVVLYGGQSARNTYLGDSWEYDGVRWSEIRPAGAPPARTYAAGAYDGKRRKMVLFGGQTAAAITGETWEFDGTTWSQRMVAGPPARRRHVMAYDAERERVVLFGGTNSAGMALPDTWEWDGSQWMPRTLATTPTARGAMTYDAAHRRILMFGGSSAATDQVWAFDGSDWSKLTPGAGPAARLSAPVAYDVARDRLVVFGGASGAVSGAALYIDTWELDCATDSWAEVSPVFTPPLRSQHMLAFDQLRGVSVLFGGVTPMSNALMTDTWSFDGSQWRIEHPLRSPPGGICPMGPCPSGMVYDSKRKRFIFVRDGGMGVGMETWAYDGATWAKLSPARSPMPRASASVVYDSARDRIVLFGGSAMMVNRADTWEFDGSTWSEITLTPSPPARQSPSMTFDARRGRVVMYGGSVGMMQALGDTWEYDGTRWTPVTTADSPGLRSGAALAFHAARGKVVLFGGDNPPMVNNDTWEFDGTNWLLLSGSGNAADRPPPRVTPRLVYDEQRHVLLLHGGDPRDDVWELTWRSTVKDELCDNMMDDDGDGVTDCADDDCAGLFCGADNRTCVARACGCSGGASELTCGNDFDDDCDGQIDCADSDCAGKAACAPEPMCGDGGDDDSDTFIDCADPGCVGMLMCERFETLCTDGRDNDGDGAMDCADLDCFLNSCKRLP